MISNNSFSATNLLEYFFQLIKIFQTKTFPSFFLILCMMVLFNKVGNAQEEKCHIVFYKCENVQVIDCGKNPNGTLVNPIALTPYLSGDCGYNSYLEVVQIAGPILPAYLSQGSYILSYEAEVYSDGVPTGIKSICSFTITVTPNTQKPTFIYCPPDITIYGTRDANGVCEASAYWHSPIAIDECGNQINLQVNFPCGQQYGEGQHSISYFAYDVFNGEFTTCNFTINIICLPVKVEDLDSYQSFIIYPNPTTSTIAIKLLEAGNSNMSINIVDMNGKVLFERKLLNNNELQYLDISHLAGGVYYVIGLKDNIITGRSGFVKM